MDQRPSAQTGVNGNMFGFIRLLLNERTFHVRLSQFVLSSSFPVSNDILQGSAINPRLFNIMLNYLY